MFIPPQGTRKIRTDYTQNWQKERNNQRKDQ